ncbi:hypothetical protein Tco_1554142, partial [Tanacetum coccineum]
EWCRCVHRTKVIKSGRRFGFVRIHLKNPDQANLIEDSKQDRDWSQHSVCFNCTLRSKTKTSQPNPSLRYNRITTKPHETGHASHTTGGRSYASVLNGKEGTQKPVLAGPITKNITLENSDLLELSDTSSVVLAKVRDVHLIINIYRVLKKEGFSDFKCKYMGDSGSGLNSAVTSQDGLPLNAWTTNAFKKIAGNWGETVFVDEDADENIANGREASGKLINDIHSIKRVTGEGEDHEKKEQMGYEMNAPGKSWILL